MSLIPFILDLADELQDFQRCLASGYNPMDIDEADFGLYPLHDVAATQQHSQQQQQQQIHQQQELHQHHQHQQHQQQHLHQQEQLNHRGRSRLLSQLYWQPNFLLHKHRHHPYHHHISTGRMCCNAKEKEGNAIGEFSKLNAANNLVGLANKRAAYPLVKKNGWVMVSMNVKQFTPDELTLKTVDNCIIIEGRHEDKEDIHGVISRHFIRKYLLPKGYDPNDVVSTLSSDGILTVKAPPQAPPKLRDESTVRIVDIQQTGPTHSAAKDMAASESESNIEKPNTPIDTTSVEKNVLIVETSEIDEPRAVVVVMMETENEVELKSTVEGQGSDTAEIVEEDTSLLAQEAQLERNDEVNKKNDINADDAEAENCTAAESNGISGNGIDSDIVKSTKATEILAESENSVAAAPSAVEETGLIESDAAIETPKTAADIAGTVETTEDVDMTVTNNEEKAEDDVETKANNDTTDKVDANTNAEVAADELSYETNDKNGDINAEEIPVAAASMSDIPVTLAKEICVSKGVVIEATATAKPASTDTNGRAGIETLANATEEVVAN